MYDFNEILIPLAMERLNACKNAELKVFVVKVNGRSIEIQGKSSWRAKSSASAAITVMLDSGSYRSDSLGNKLCAAMNIIPNYHHQKHMVKEFKKYLLEKKIITIESVQPA